MQMGYCLCKILWQKRECSPVIGIRNWESLDCASRAGEGLAQRLHQQWALTFFGAEIRFISVDG